MLHFEQCERAKLRDDLENMLMLKDEYQYFVAKIRFDAAENEPLEVC